VKFIYQELSEDGAFIPAQLKGNEVGYSLVLAKAGNSLRRDNVNRHFQGEISNTQRHSSWNAIRELAHLAAEQYLAPDCGGARLTNDLLAAFHSRLNRPSSTLQRPTLVEPAPTAQSRPFSGRR